MNHFSVNYTHIYIIRIDLPDIIITIEGNYEFVFLNKTPDFICVFDIEIYSYISTWCLSQVQCRNTEQIWLKTLLILFQKWLMSPRENNQNRINISNSNSTRLIKKTIPKRRSFNVKNECQSIRRIYSFEIVNDKAYTLIKSHPIESIKSNHPNTQLSTNLIHNFSLTSINTTTNINRSFVFQIE